MFYVFAIVGMEVFQGRIRFFGYGNLTDPKQMYCGAPELKDSLFYESHYCNNNFNDFFSAMMVLSTLLIENNWHNILSRDNKIQSENLGSIQGACLGCM